MTTHPASTSDAGLLTVPLVAHTERTVPVRQPAASVLVATLVAGGVLVSGSGGPLPASMWAAAFLFFAVESDLRRLRIPNLLTFPALLAALLHQGLLGAGLETGLLGAGLALALLLPAWLLGFLGAGDVKATMPLGALWGPESLLILLVWTSLISGVVGLVQLARAGALGELATRWSDSLRASFLLQRPTWHRPEPGSAAAQVLPFGFVLGLGTIATLSFGAAWA